MMAEMSSSSSPSSLTPDGVVTKASSNPNLTNSQQQSLLMGAIGTEKDFNSMRNRIEVQDDEDSSSLINNNNNNNNIPPPHHHHHNNNNTFSGRPSSKSPPVPDDNSSQSSIPGTGHAFQASHDINNKESEDFEDGAEEDEIADRRSGATSLPYLQESMKGKGESIPMEEEDNMMRVEGDEGNNTTRGLLSRQSVVKNEVMAVDEEYSQESENEMPVEYEDDEEDSEKEEHRITVREALMSRAFHQQQQATKYGGGKHSFTGGGSRLISPSISPPSHHNHGNQDSSSNPASFIKSPLNIVNGHGGIQRHGHNSLSRHQNNRSSFTSYHQQQQQSLSASRHHSSSRYHHQHLHSRHSGSQIQHQPDQNTEAFLKSDRKSSVPLSPNHTDLKPDSMGASDPSGSLNGIGNALLSLASLGSLAALQQSIPNFMASVTGHGGQSGGGQQQNPHNTPLNLTNPNSIPNNSSSPPFHPHSSVFHSKTHPLMQHLPHQPLTSPQGSQRSSTLSPNSLVANAIANLAGNSGAGSLANIGQPGSSIPQLILASGQISQGIQGAQLLIPTSQGIMSQTVLTIPITQPGSPIQNVLSPNLQQQNAGGSGNGSRGGGSSHHQSSMDSLNSLKMSNNGGTRDKSILHSNNNNAASSQRNHHDQLSPPGVSRVSRSPASPELPGGQMSSPLMGLGSHLVSSQIGSHMSTIHEKLVMEHNGGVNGVRNSHGKRERESGGGGGSSGTPGGLHHHHHHHHHTTSSLLAQQPKSSPCSVEGSMNDNESDRFSELDDDQMVEGINLDEIKEFAKAFKLRRLSLGLTQTQVGQALSVTEGPAYSQSAICSALAWQLAQSQTYPSSSIHQQSMFEKLDITPKSAQKIKPVLERWMKEAEERYKNGHQNLNEFVGMEPSKKRKRRTSFTPQALELLNNHFERNTHPSGAEITTLAHQLGYEREVIRIWFCNKRQALKNTVRMMSKGSSPM